MSNNSQANWVNPRVQTHVRLCCKSNTRE